MQGQVSHGTLRKSIFKYRQARLQASFSPFGNRKAKVSVSDSRLFTTGTPGKDG